MYALNHHYSGNTAFVGIISTISANVLKIVPSLMSLWKRDKNNFMAFLT